MRFFWWIVAFLLFASAMALYSLPVFTPYSDRAVPVDNEELNRLNQP